MVCRRRQTTDLCRFLGLSEKMPGVINVLANSGRHIDAVNLAISFELTEQFSPVSLLNSYLTESRRQCSPTAQNDALDPLQKRILQLEKAKTEKKRATKVSKPQHKRPRANGMAAGYMPRNTNFARMTERKNGNYVQIVEFTGVGKAVADWRNVAAVVKDKSVVTS